jgi:hypothetical protein
MAVRKDRDIDRREVDTNPDPITGAHGAHPVGVGLGTAVAGAAAGAAGGAVAGPVGAVAGAVIGGVAGGLGGKAAAEAIDPTVEDTYWRDAYANRPYYDEAVTYDTYAPAYRHGWESRTRYPDRSFDEAEPELRRDWESSQHNSQLKWERAKLATRDAWHRVERALPGDADGDERKNVSGVPR